MPRYIGLSLWAAYVSKILVVTDRTVHGSRRTINIMFFNTENVYNNVGPNVTEELFCAVNIIVCFTLVKCLGQEFVHHRFKFQ